MPPLARSVFPVTRRWAYCDHAAVGPLPQPTRDAMVAALDAQSHDGTRGILSVEARKEAVREAVAAAINAHTDEIAFMRSTSDGALLVANGIDWNEGDEIVICDNEFGANAHPWLDLRRDGVSTVLVRTPGQRMTVETLERLATPRTRLVAVSMVTFVDGYRHDIDAIGAWCKRRGVMLAVDAIQGFGHLPLDVRAAGMDFCYFGVAKWLLAPQGLSVVYVRRDRIEQLRPSLCSWRSVEDPMRFLDYAQDFAHGARRFEGATINYPAVVAFGESLALLRAAGLPQIEQHVLALTDRVIAAARERGIDVIGETERTVRSGIVVVGHGGRSVDDLSRRAADAGVQASIRDSGVRISPHGYNTIDDVDRVMSIFD